MKIITVPHPTLRATAQPITQVDKKLHMFVRDLGDTLAHKKNPRGVGLAAPQVNVKWRMFATQLSSTTQQEDKDEHHAVLRVFINPKIIDHSEKVTFGPNPKEPRLEGCLSIPELYGPVPRWQTIKLEFQTLESNELVLHSEVFEDFAARVVQHEEDHLNGILFVDYTAKYDLPLYREDEESGELVELEPDMIAALIEKTK